LPESPVQDLAVENDQAVSRLQSEGKLSHHLPSARSIAAVATTVLQDGADILETEIGKVFVSQSIKELSEHRERNGRNVCSAAPATDRASRGLCAARCATDHVWHGIFVQKPRPPARWSDHRPAGIAPHIHSRISRMAANGLRSSSSHIRVESVFVSPRPPHLGQALGAAPSDVRKLPKQLLQ